MTPHPLTPDQARSELRELRASWEYAYANAHGCSCPRDPRLEPVLERERQLLAMIAGGPAV